MNFLQVKSIYTFKIKPTLIQFNLPLAMHSEIDEKIQCNICYDIMLTPAKLDCGHQFCLYCIRSIMYKEQQHAACPLCRKKMNFPTIDKQRQTEIINYIIRNNKNIKVYHSQAQTINHVDKNLTVSQPFYFLLSGDILHGDIIWGNGSVHSSYKGQVGRTNGQVTILEDESIKFVDVKCHYSNSPYQVWIGVLKFKGLNSYLPESYYEYEAEDSIYQWNGWGRHSSGILNINMKYLETQAIQNQHLNSS